MHSYPRLLDLVIMKLFENSKSRIEIVSFTLIEIIVAVSIMMLVFLAAGMGVMSVQKSWIKVQRRSRELKRVILIDRIVNGIFANIAPFTWKTDQLVSQQIFLGDPDRTIFASKHPVTIKSKGGVRFISIRRDGDSIVAEYSDIPLLYWDEGTRPQYSEVIAEDVKNIKFKYAAFDVEGALSWVDDWNEEINKGIPVALSMTIEWKDGTTNHWLKRTAGESRNTSFGIRRYPVIQ